MMTLRELQQQVLGLSISERWQLAQWLLSLLERDSLTSAHTSSNEDAPQNTPSAPSNFAQALTQFRTQVATEGSDIKEIDFFAGARD